MKCSNCNFEIQPGSRFCMNCGAKAEPQIKRSFCPNCGAEHSENDRFCMQCGQPLNCVAPTPAPAPTQASTPVPVPAPTTKKKGKWIIAAVVALLVLAAAATGVWYFTDRNSSDSVDDESEAGSYKDKHKDDESEAYDKTDKGDRDFNFGFGFGKKEEVAGNSGAADHAPAVDMPAEDNTGAGAADDYEWPAADDEPAVPTEEPQEYPDDESPAAQPEFYYDLYYELAEYFWCDIEELRYMLNDPYEVEYDYGGYFRNRYGYCDDTITILAEEGTWEVVEIAIHAPCELYLFDATYDSFAEEVLAIYESIFGEPVYVEDGSFYEFSDGYFFAWVTLDSYGYVEELRGGIYGEVLEGEPFFGEEYFIFYESAERYLEIEELEVMNHELLSLGRNEILARHDVIFASDDINTYFGITDWYVGKVYIDDFDWSELNEYELYNYELIYEYEQEMYGGSYYNEY